MLWQLENAVFDDERGVLRSESNEILLEPKASALLKFFVNHPKQDLSRDRLITEIWHGHIVSDNAINRVIVQIRKALGDESKPKRFVKTVPKVGYRFIAEAQPLEPGTVNDQHLRTVKPSSPKLLILIAALLLAIPTTWFFLFNRTAPEERSTSVQPVSRESGWQFDADLSPNLKYLIYSVNENSDNILYLQNRESGFAEQVSPDSGRAHGGRWSHDGNYFVYLYHFEDNCVFHKVTVSEEGRIDSNEVLQTCRSNSDTNFALSLDDEILYFVERSSVFSPFEAYALDMQEQQRWKLAQPLAKSFGNHYLDVHPETGKVLLLSEPKPGQSAVYEIDVPNNSFQKVHEFDYDLYTAIWGHKPNTVIHPAEHPSYQLLETHVGSGKFRVLISDSRRISTPRRINNGEDYLFASYLYNRDIHVEGYSGNNFNSAVMDYLPEYSNAGDQLAFISKRGGFSKILILHIESAQLRTLESDDQGLTFYNLSWSPEDASIAANTSKGILIYDLQTNAQRLLDTEQLTYAVDWYDSDTLSYSEHVDLQWRVYLRNAKTGLITAHELESVDAETVYVLSDNDVHLSIASGKATDSDGKTYDLSQCSNRYLGRYQSNIKFDNGTVYCPQRDSISNVISIEAGQQPQVFSDQYAEVEYYSIVNGQSATAYPANTTSDVMRTRRQ